MRMWMINSIFMCRKHLLGEHGEIHKHRHNFEKKHSISGRIFPIVQIEPEQMENRHNELANEMLARGYNHNSPYCLPNLEHLSNSERLATVDLEHSLSELIFRCNDCEQRILYILGTDAWKIDEVLSLTIENNE